MGRIFKKLLEFLKKILKVLGPLLIIAYIACWIFAPALIPIIHGWLSTAWTAISSAASTLWTTVSGWIGTAWKAIGSFAGGVWDAASGWLAEAEWSEVLKLAAGAAIILNPEGVAEGVGTVVDAVGDTIGTIVEKVAVPLLPWILGGVGLWFLFRRRDDDDESSRPVIIRESR